MRLTKHHGLGNDFLVLLDLAGRRPITADEAIALCDRHRGVGADGVIRVTRGSVTPLSMTLRNADGGLAEMSGNGISCLAQAAVMAGVVAGPQVAVSTDAGIRTVEILDRPGRNRHRVRVDMGAVKVGDALPEWEDGPILRAAPVDAGNPHLVLHVAEGDDRPDLTRLGELANRSIPGGINVELIELGPGDGELTMTVFERGVGLTDACGTGACAAAVAARGWELVPARVVVHQPGGDAVVDMAETVRMTVEVEAIATIEWPWPAR